MDKHRYFGLRIACLSVNNQLKSGFLPEYSKIKTDTIVIVCNAIIRINPTKKKLASMPEQDFHVCN